MAKRYDIHCFELAEFFLEGDAEISANRAHLLALEIQTTIEEWIERQRRPCVCCGKPDGNGDHSDCIFF